MTQRTSIGDVLTTNKTDKDDNEHRTLSTEFQTFKRDDNRPLNPCRGSLRTLRRGMATRSMPEAGNITKAPYQEYEKTSYGDDSNTLST